MFVEDIFHIRGRGTVVTGVLQGDGELTVGDTLLCAGVRCQVKGIEQFRSTLRSASPGANVGLLLADGIDRELLRGNTVQFQAKGASGPQLDVSPQKKRWRR